jgi:peptidoglycan biosynthesis protein MviN/MurJ (putative lipid II flippase)
LVNAGTVAISSAAGAALFAVLDDKWKVPGLAIGHSIGFSIGAVVLGYLFARRVGPVRDHATTSAVVKAGVVSVLALVVMLGIRVLVPATGKLATLGTLLATLAAGAGVYILVMARAGSNELQRIAEVVGRARTRTRPPEA